MTILVAIKALINILIQCILNVFLLLIALKVDLDHFGQRAGKVDYGEFFRFVLLDDYFRCCWTNVDFGKTLVIRVFPK